MDEYHSQLPHLEDWAPSGLICYGVAQMSAQWLSRRTFWADMEPMQLCSGKAGCILEHMETCVSTVEDPSIGLQHWCTTDSRAAQLPALD